MIVEYFAKFPLLVAVRLVRSLKFSDRKLVYTVVVNKEHLTPEQREQITEIKSNMNTKRF